jgi:hypothetical protein
MRISLLLMMLALPAAATPKVTTVTARVAIAEATPDGETDVGTPATLRYDVENTGKVAVQLWRSGFFINHRIVLIGPDGKPPKLTAWGAEHARWFSPGGGGNRDKNVAVWLKYGEKAQPEGAYDLATYAELDVPGKYTLRVDYDDTIAFGSNTAVFWRLPKGSRAHLDALDAGGAVAEHLSALVKLGVSAAQDPSTKRYRVLAVK